MDKHYQPAAEGGRRRLYSLLKMRDVLNIKIDAELVLVGFKSWFRCQIRVQRGRKPWGSFRGRNCIGGPRYRRKSCSKSGVLWSLPPNQLSRLFSLSFNPFSMGFFLIERPMEVLFPRKEWIIFVIWGRSYSTPKFGKSDFSEITFVKSIFSRTIFSML